jgi:AhpD family alkylhydroperoxidase
MSLTESQRAMPGIAASNVLLTLVRSPDLFTPWLTLAQTMGLSDQLPPRQRELAILRVALRTECEYVWANHVHLALGVGLTAAEIEVLPGDSASWSDTDGAVLHAVDELCSEDCVSDETFAALAATRDDAQMIAILTLISYYRMNAGLLNSLGVQAEAARPRLGQVPSISAASAGRAPAVDDAHGASATQPASWGPGNTWHIVFHHPTGDQDLTLVIAVSAGAISGSVTNAALGVVVPIVEGTVDGDRFSFRAPLNLPVEIDIVYRGTVAGDSISGDVTIRGGGTFPFEGTRSSALD